MQACLAGLQVGWQGVRAAPFSHCIDSCKAAVLMSFRQEDTAVRGSRAMLGATFSAMGLLQAPSRLLCGVIQAGLVLGRPNTSFFTLDILSLGTRPLPHTLPAGGRHWG